jgi:hypothetical protein
MLSDFRQSEKEKEKRLSEIGQMLSDFGQGFHGLNKICSLKLHQTPKLFISFCLHV